MLPRCSRCHDVISFDFFILLLGIAQRRSASSVIVIHLVLSEGLLERFQHLDEPPPLEATRLPDDAVDEDHLGVQVTLEGVEVHE